MTYEPEIVIEDARYFFAVYVTSDLYGPSYYQQYDRQRDAIDAARALQRRYGYPIRSL